MVRLGCVILIMTHQITQDTGCDHGVVMIMVRL